MVDGSHVLAQMRKLPKSGVHIADGAFERLLASVHANMDLEHRRVRKSSLTDGAGVWLITGMLALMHCQLRLLHKFGATHSALIRFLLQMDAQVLAQMAFEAGIANFADKRLLVTMETVQMLLQRVFTHECLAADLAHEVVLSLVPFQMVQQVRAVGERKATQVADERAHFQVSALVLRQQTDASELLWTFRTSGGDKTKVLLVQCKAERKKLTY